MQQQLAQDQTKVINQDLNHLNNNAQHQAHINTVDNTHVSQHNNLDTDALIME